jgi:hypothetical protein
MAGIDASIPLQVRQAQFDSPVNALAKILQVQNMQQDQQMGRMKMDEYRRSVEDSNALRADLSQPGADPYAALLRRGRVKDASDWQKGQIDQRKTAADMEKTQIETNLKKIGLGAQILSTARDQASYDQARAVAQANGLDVSRMPPQFDPAFVQSKLDESLSMKDRLEQRWKQMEYTTPNANARLTANTASPESLLSAETQRRGQNMVDARSRESNSIQQQAARTQVVETPEGVMLIDKATAQARPATAGGRPLQGKPSAATEKEMLGLRQQDAIIDGAIAAVDKTPDAFSMGRGMATMAGAIPESVAGRFDNDAQRQARSYVFNNVSKVINERVGAAQSAQELARLRSFLPAETDNAAQIKSKLQAFKSYLTDMKAGTKGSGGATGGWSIQRVN